MEMTGGIGNIPGGGPEKSRPYGFAGGDQRMSDSLPSGDKGSPYGLTRRRISSRDPQHFQRAGEPEKTQIIENRQEVLLENWPILFDKISDATDALLVLTILKEGQRNGTGKVTYGEIRKSLREKMDLSSESEAERVLGKYNTLQEHCNGMDSDIVQQERIPGGNVFYSIADSWQSQVEAYIDRVLSYSMDHLPFGVFLSPKKAENGLPIDFEIGRFLNSQLLDSKAKPTSNVVTHEAIITRFPEAKMYLEAQLYRILLQYHTMNIFSWERVQKDEVALECRLSPGAPQAVDSGTPRMQHAYQALVALQNESEIPNQYFTSLDIAFRMAKLFPETYDTHDSTLYLFMHNFSKFMERMQTQNKQHGNFLEIHKRVSFVHVTENNNYQAMNDFDLLVRGQIAQKNSFIATFVSETDPNPTLVRDIWLAGRYFDPRHYSEYKNKILPGILNQLQKIPDGLTREKALEIAEDFTRRPDILLYFLENDGYVTLEGDTYRVKVSKPAQSTSSRRETVEPVNSVSEKRYEIIVDERIKNMARDRKYEHPFKEEAIAAWKEKMRNKERLEKSVGFGSWVGNEKRIWEFYQELQKRNKDIVVFENSGLVVINKPPKFGSHRSTLGDVGIEELARDALDPEATLATWLDPDTSGLIILAKSTHILEGLLSQTIDRVDSGMTEVYRAICDGSFYGELPYVWTSMPLERVGPRLRAVMPGEPQSPHISFGMASFTREGIYYDPNSQKRKTQFYAQLFKGSSRHLRALASNSLQLPVTGDPLYAEISRNAPRLMLHCEEISIIDPGTGKRITIKAPLESVFQNYLAELTKIDLNEMK